MIKSLLTIVITSHMFLIILGICTCEEITLCFKKTADCPEGTTDEKTIMLQNANTLDSKNTYKIVTDKDDLVIEESNIPYIVAITGYGTSAAAACSIQISKALTLTNKLTLENVDVKIDGKSASLTATINELVANKGGKVSAGTTNAPTITIKKLNATSMSSAKDNIAYALAATIVDDDAVCKVTGNSDKTEIDNCDSTPVKVEVLSTCLTLEVTSYVKTNGKSIEGADSFESVVTVTTINLEYGNRDKAILTINPSASLEKSKGKLIINVNTYFTKLATELTNSAKECIILNADYEVENNERKSVPPSENYCISLNSDYSDTECIKGSPLLWSVAELRKLDKVSVSLFGYTPSTSNALTLELDDFKEKSMEFIGIVNQQSISLNLKTKDETVTGDIKFNNISVKSIIPKDQNDATLSFKNIFLKKAEMAVEKATAKKLQAETIKVHSENAISDADSFDKFKNEKPSKSFTIIDVKQATFGGDGKKVTIDGVEFTSEKIPLPFTIQATDEKVETKLSIKKDGESAGKAIPFMFNVLNGTVLAVEFDGDWSANEIVVNVEAGSNYTGTVKTGGVAPVLSKTGSGTATLGGEEVKAASSDESPVDKGGLSGGAIAGIVIAVLVVVSAVVAAAVIVIKKKSKVAN